MHIEFNKKHVHINQFQVILDTSLCKLVKLVVILFSFIPGITFDEMYIKENYLFKYVYE